MSKSQIPRNASGGEPLALDDANVNCHSQYWRQKDNDNWGMLTNHLFPNLACLSIIVMKWRNFRGRQWITKVPNFTKKLERQRCHTNTCTNVKKKKKNCMDARRLPRRRGGWSRYRSRSIECMHIACTNLLVKSEAELDHVDVVLSVSSSFHFLLLKSVVLARRVGHQCMQWSSASRLLAVSCMCSCWQNVVTAQQGG